MQLALLVLGYRHVVDCLVPGKKNAEAFAESTALTLGASGKFLGSSSACSSQKNALSKRTWRCVSKSNLAAALPQGG